MSVPEIIDAKNETIAAIATGSGPAGIGIIRISGPDAFTVVDRLTRPRTPTASRKGHTLTRALAFDPTGNESIDDGLIAVFHAPHSFTGENVVEFQGHGGTVTLTRLFATILTCGARAARPGEFSERAFVNGKLDLAQAEAIADMITAGTIEAQRAARRQLSGELSFSIESCTHLLRESLAFIEASIDFPEEIGDLDRPAVAARLYVALHKIDALLSQANYGRRLREGITVVLTGKPNVGKSSLLNALSGTERAIVTPVPGTTRDVVEEQLNVAGIPVRALDTAGLRETTDIVEQIGVDRARRAIADADIVVAVLDASTPLTDDERNLIASIQERPALIALNKTDTANPVLCIDDLTSPLPVVPISAVTGDGIAALCEAIAARATNGESNHHTLPLVTSARHVTALQRAREAILRADSTLHADREPELISVDVFAAINALGEITGSTAREDVIASIFSQFCIGK
jgi:tRNA modification GTPase